MYNDINDLPREKLLELIGVFAKNWLALDGVWFQSIEQKYGMDEAMEHDANAWQRYTSIEARRIKAFLGLPEKAGLEGLRQALQFRLYAPLNAAESSIDGNALTYKVVTCRVQTARARKNMPFHPCKAVGLVKYDGFAKTIDPRFRTECLSCHPDITQPEYCCVWRFCLEDTSKNALLSASAKTAHCF